MPLVFQYNKRDLRNILPVDKLQQSLNPGAAPAFEAAAVHGVGVFETLKEISRLSLDAIRQKINEQKKGGVVGVERRVPRTASASERDRRRAGEGAGERASTPRRRRPRRARRPSAPTRR